MATLGLDTICLAPAIDRTRLRQDTRTTALFAGSIELLRNINVWPRCAHRAAPLKALRMVDDTGRLLRAPELLFQASELGVSAFGHNIANAALIEALLARSEELPHLKRLETAGVVEIHPTERCIHLKTHESRQFSSRLIIGADGRKSRCREALGAHTKEWHHDQVAIATWFAHAFPHQHTSTEFHRRPGPLTTVPLPDNRSSLVWVERPDEAKRLMSLNESVFIETLEERLSSFLGRITELAPRAAFPLTVQSVSPIAASRIALVGEAAHVIPPIGAQGLNLGFRDIAALGDIVMDHRNSGDPGSAAALSDYRAARKTDVASRTLAVDLLNRSLISDMLPASAARGLGLHAMAMFPALRRTMMRQSMQPTQNIPRLMRPGATFQRTG